MLVHAGYLLALGARSFRVEFVNQRMLELQNWTMEIAGPGTQIGHDAT